jgi:AhpD family alkylhydroperoxidase
MKTTLKPLAGAVALCAAVLLLSTSLLAQESKSDASMKAEAEMEAAFGTVPAMMKVYPEHMRADVWEWFRATMSPDAAIPAKYTELISLGVAAQIPCTYCVYAHTTKARMLGATEAEIREAIASAAATRHWSTVLNGADVSLDEFKAEWDGILAYVKKQSEAQEATSK